MPGHGELVVCIRSSRWRCTIAQRDAKDMIVVFDVSVAHEGTGRDDRVVSCDGRHTAG